MPSIALPGAGHGVRDRGEGEGRRGQGLLLAAAAAGGGPDDRPAPRPADRRADRRRPVADPRRGGGRPAEVALRRRGDAEAAARALPGDDPRLGQGPRAPQEAERRPRPVRRLPHRGRAARGRRLRVRQRDQGRRDPDELHPRGREGRGRGDGPGRRGRLPGQGRARAPLRRLLPHGRLVGDGVQDRGSIAMRQALEDAAPVLLEPIMLVTASVPDRASATSWATCPPAAAARWARRASAA